MTSQEITEVMNNSNGKLTDWQCRCIVHYMMGYMRHASNIEAARQAFFTEIKAALEGKAIPVL